MINFFKRRRPSPVEDPAPETEHKGITSHIVSDVGCERDLNEDNGRIVRAPAKAQECIKGTLAVVADGMGGSRAGEVASLTAVDTLAHQYFASTEPPREALLAAVHEANRKIFSMGKRDRSMQGMGTTCTALAIVNDRAYMAHVGDSRLYMVRGGGIYQLTQDHSQVMHLVRMGVLSPEQARIHPDKNIITRAVGTSPKVEPDTWDEPMPVRPGDCFILCSDGLHDRVADSEIEGAVLSGSPQSACESLVALARERGGYDNITIAVLRLDALNDPAANIPATREVSVEL